MTDAELTERVDWVCQRTGVLSRAAKRLSPAASTDHLTGLRDEVGKVIDAARHLAEDRRLPARLRRRYRRLAGHLNDVYAQLGEVYVFRCWQEGTDPERGADG
jgi:hypothetical protein